MSSEGTSTSSDTERMAATESAVNILAQGKRNMVCGEIPTAVNQFQEACKLLSKAYGETAKECADAYFCYGQALLDLARMENGVLGNALQGVPDTDDESNPQKDEQFEKEELKVEEREKLRQEVYDAMSEKQTEKDERKKNDRERRRLSGDTMEIAMDTEDKPDKEKSEDDLDKKDKSDDASKDKDQDGEDLKKKKSEKEDKKLKAGLKEKHDKDMKKEKHDKDMKPDEECDKISEDKTKCLKDEEKMEEGKKDKEDEEGTSEEGDEEEEEEGTEGEGEATGEEGTEEEGEATAEDEPAAGKTETGEDTTSQDGSQDGDNPDDISNLQLAWEMLELAKLIYLKDESKEAKLRVAESHLKLGELGLETEQYDEAVKDLNKCLEIQKSNLDAENRRLAETHYQLGLAFCFNKQFTESVDSYRAAIKVIEDRIASLNKILDKATDAEKDTKDFDCPIYKAKKEVEDLKEILPDMKTKIEDVEDERKNSDELKNLAKEALGGLASAVQEVASSAPKEDVKTSDISHLVKRKRKSEEPADDECSKKAKPDQAGGDTKVNGHEQDEKKEEAMQTKS